MSSRDVVIEMLGAFNQRRFADFAAAYTSDAELTYPQSGERIAGRYNIRAMVEAFPSPPRFTINDVHSAETSWRSKPTLITGKDHRGRRPWSTS